MTAPRIGWLLLALAIVLQWALPASLAARSEYVLRHGARYYLRTAPVDPLDAFRGRYVALRFADVEVRLPAGTDWRAGMRVAVPLSTGADRFARFGVPSPTAPARGDFIIATLGSVGLDGRATLVLPFDRYYLNERLAPAAERAYREVSNSPAPAYVSIRVRDGAAVLEQLFIDNQTVQRYLARTPR
ncbi:MAG TPA: GDYXXLXY domain-containing protein [Solimonas sp.]|nr:GDYXXLXY domain-containing protein [Solimonas sp.]